VFVPTQVVALHSADFEEQVDLTLSREIPSSLRPVFFQISNEAKGSVDSIAPA
jgi:hypothetical protein